MSWSDLPFGERNSVPANEKIMASLNVDPDIHSIIRTTAYELQKSLNFKFD
jgi:hypothetical protein